MNYYKKKIVCWQDDDEVLQNKDRKDGKVWLNQMIMNNRVREWTNRVAMERYSSYQDVCCILNLRIVLLIIPQSVIWLFCANKHSFNLTQQGIPYIYKGCSWGKCYLFRLLPNNVKLNERAVSDVPCRAGYTLKPKSVISVMMITTLVFVQMSLRFEGAMGFHCNRKTERQMTKRKFVCA